MPLSLAQAARGDAESMGIGSSLFLIAVGAILYFAVNADISGLEISTIGLILMVVGIVGLLISLFFLSSARRGDRTFVHDRRDVY
jgi:beta-lactamase regulating signal transducer with metallopeptidase domain